MLVAHDDLERSRCHRRSRGRPGVREHIDVEPQRLGRGPPDDEPLTAPVTMPLPPATAAAAAETETPTPPPRAAAALELDATGAPVGPVGRLVRP
ncbi:hypothetical protein ColKHC_02437 [Colletotrichum higginsianum]|nr:hypothetical protein ColKHC_02437 [Colletotrichum higginsianum]